MPVPGKISIQWSFFFRAERWLLKYTQQYRYLTVQSLSISRNDLVISYGYILDWLSWVNIYSTFILDRGLNSCRVTCYGPAVLTALLTTHKLVAIRFSLFLWIELENS